MRAVVDVPFSHGTLAVSSPEPEVFTQRDLDILGDLVAGIAHELNTPVGAIRSMGDTLNRAIGKLKQALVVGFPQEYADDPTSQAALKAITDASRVLGAGAQRVGEIVGSLRNFVRLYEKEYQVADLHEGLESTLTLLQSQLTKDITVVKEYGDLTPLYCAPGQLNQVFMHLLKNAIEAVDGTEKICINTCRQDRKVYIRIRDTGAGIPAAQLENLFDIGFNIQGGQVKMAFGWSAAYAIVRNHGGEIEVTSEVGKGTEVTVSMPIRTSDQA
jgi:two-component system NtrC family sensor kinase